MKWRYTPDDVAVFRNFGIVANRGVALCDGQVFELTLDMTIVSLEPATGRLERRVPIAEGCSGRVLELRLLRDECADLREPPPDRRRRRVRIRRARLRHGLSHEPLPGLAESFLDDPAGRNRVAANGTLVGGGVVWTPTTVDTTTNTLYFGTGSATPLYFPSIRPGSNPRADSLIAVDLATGRMRWWQQQMAHNEWSYDTAQPPLVYTAQGRRQEAADRLRGDDGGRVVRLRREDGPADLPASQGDRPHRAPGAQPGHARRRCSRRRSAA